MAMRTISCHERRMLRALHRRAPLRRSECRSDRDRHARAQAPHWCMSGRKHPLSGLRNYRRRPAGG